MKGARTSAGLPRNIAGTTVAAAAPAVASAAAAVASAAAAAPTVELDSSGDDIQPAHRMAAESNRLSALIDPEVMELVAGLVLNPALRADCAEVGLTEETLRAVSARMYEECEEAAMLAEIAALDKENDALDKKITNINRQNLAIERSGKDLDKRAAEYQATIDRAKEEEPRLTTEVQKRTERNDKLKSDLMELKELAKSA